MLFHGATAPWGLSRAYPNVLGYEAVRGLEYDKFNEQGAPPPHDVTLPFTRMLAGPMDYTPGAMRALNRANWKAVSDLPSAQGTIVHQLAMYVVYDAPLVMLSDMPSAYEKEPAALEMLSAVPTTWDETIGVDGRIGESAVVRTEEGRRVVDRSHDRLVGADSRGAALLHRRWDLGGVTLDGRRERRQSGDRSPPLDAVRRGDWKPAPGARAGRRGRREAAAQVSRSYTHPP